MTSARSQPVGEGEGGEETTSNIDRFSGELQGYMIEVGEATGILEMLDE
ncbi:MAG: hypothetical protein Q8W48_02745 [Candidatus Palauibacterales bacterium]|nr:hypothetical protein [Candidatus Palauibacterales bacterium]